MGQTILRGVSVLIGLLMVIMGITWVVDPATAAGQLGMPLLEGAGLSTQVGDLTAFFLSIGVMTLLGIWLRREERWGCVTRCRAVSSRRC